MSDTMTNPGTPTAPNTPSAGSAATPAATGDNGTDKPKRNVDYTLEIVDELPERATRTSPLEDALEKIKALFESDPTKLQDAEGKPKPVIIGRYDQATAAGAAKNVLGQRHGKSPNVEGWEFAIGRIEQNGKTRTALFVMYDPSKVVDGAKEEWERKEKGRKDALAAARKVRDDEKAKAEGTVPAPSTGPAPSPTPVPTPSVTPAPGAPQGQTVTVPAPPTPPVPTPPAAPTQ